MNIAALNVIDASNGDTNFTNWNQMSDRNLPSVQGAYHGLYAPSRGSSTRSSLTRMRPGACAPGGKGVDIKHNSYARYLARRKATNIRTQTRISRLRLFRETRREPMESLRTQDIAYVLRTSARKFYYRYTIECPLICLWFFPIKRRVGRNNREMLVRSWPSVPPRDVKAITP